MKDSFKEEVALLQSHIELHEKLKEEIKKKQISYEESIKHLKEEIKKTSDIINTLYTNIDQEILEDHKETKETKYFGGFTIKNYKSIDYDYEKALDWAKEKDMFVILDTKGFEKAVESLNLDFVKIEKNPKVTHPKIIKLEG